MSLRRIATNALRREAIEQELNIQLPGIGHYSIDEDVASAKNCENMIGVIQVPLGIAGPVSIISHGKKSRYYLPLATTEGALIASVSRGCKATFQNGINVLCNKVGITRAPVFVVDDIQSGQQFTSWLENNIDKLKEITSSTSSHLKLLDIRTWSLGRNVFVRFRFDTQDAMGMNMATIAVTRAASYIEANTHAICMAVSGNMCVDKKPNFLNFIEGRGYNTSAEAILPPEVVSTVLKTTVKDVFEVSQRKLIYGSIMSGSIGTNAHFANIIAAIFLATGQDIAHVAECAMGVTSVEILENGSLYIAVILPDLVVGVVGGGTRLGTQKEALSILGISGGNDGSNAKKLAEIVACSVLAGELSLLSSLAEKSLSRAHEMLGR